MWFYNHLIGIQGDNVGADMFFYKEYIAQPFGLFKSTAFYSNQPFSIFYQLIYKLFGFILGYNILVLVTTLLVLFFAFIFFKKLFDNNIIACMLSFQVILSNFFLYRIREHIELSQIWVIFILLYILFFKKESVYYGFMIFLTIFLTSLISNYLGFFAILTFLSYFLVYLLYSIAERIRTKVFFENNVFVLKQYFYTLIFLFFACSIYFFPYLSASFTQTKDNAPLNFNMLNVSRSMEDFFYFSSRPWYYVLPSVDSVVLGKVSSKLINILQNDWGYWLTSNYFKQEHASSYLGILNITFSLYGLFYVYKIYKKKTNLHIILTIPVILILMLLSMPPFFTISLHKIYLPSILFVNYLPVLRVLSRLGVYTYILNLIFVGFGYLALYNRCKKSVFKGLVILILIVNFIEFYIPLEITDYSNIPDIYSYIKKHTPNDSLFAVYPYSKTDEILIWIPYFERKVLNIRGYTNNKYNFNSLDFTRSLVTNEGLGYFRSVGGTHVLYFPNSSTESNFADKDFFMSSDLLQVVASYSYNVQPDHTKMFYKINDRGLVYDNTVVLYKLR